VRDHIICIAADESVLSSLHQQLATWLGESYALDAVRSLPAALRLFDDLVRVGESVAVVLVEHDLLSGAEAAGGRGESGVTLLIEAHQRFPLAGKVLLVDPSTRDHGEALAQGVRHAGLSSYLSRPYEALQLRLTIEGLIFQYRLQRKNERLLYTLQDQKRELEVMNHNLEARIRERTMALEEANRRLSQLAVTDGLTGLFNHRYLQEHLVLEVERSLRTGIPLGMLMVDVDNFRLYNNRFGHQTGDEVLRRVARLIGEHRRVNDVVARYGGEEFALLLINADHRVAANIGERLRARVCAEPFPQNHELPGGMLTISVGVASCPTDGTTAASLLAAADAALFRAKHAGRNQVRVAGDPSEVFYVNVGVAGAASEDQLVGSAAAAGAPEKW
jgi:diguanylate cyclase (GGDEF)-like protein